MNNQIRKKTVWLRLLCAVLICATVLSLTACAGKSSENENNDEKETKAADNSAAVVESEDPIMIQIEMENGGIMKLELYPDIAPITVNNFVKLVKEGFYDGLILHRIVKDFMIQGGDPTGTGAGGSDEKIKGEFSQNGVQNTLSHTRGTISMARSASMNSASSQFFIVHKDAKMLDGAYAAFGRMTEGFEVLDEIANVETKIGASGEKSTPVQEQKIKSITVIDS